MYLGIDVGGTKTLVASLNNDGVIQQSYKFPTPKKYEEFLKELTEAVEKLSTSEFIAAGIGIPATQLNRDRGTGTVFSNLPWKNISVRQDVKKIAHCPVVVENDAKLGGLSEAMMVKDEFKKVLYITIGTGIGIALIDNETIDTEMGDGGGGTLLLEHNRKLEPWETFASGHAIVQRFGQRASDITDQKTWQIIAHDIALGLIDLIALMQPEVVVLGGGIGTHYEKFKDFLNHELATYKSPLFTIPPIRQAARPELAVVYGCYDLAKTTYGKTT